jgi:flagellar biosynthetic protein FliQ
LKVATPIMLVALVVGLTIALFQALTQIQEMTLTFVPKILVIFLMLVLYLPYILNTMQGFMLRVADRIATIS